MWHRLVWNLQLGYPLKDIWYRWELHGYACKQLHWRSHFRYNQQMLLEYHNPLSCCLTYQVKFVCGLIVNHLIPAEFIPDNETLPTPTPTKVPAKSEDKTTPTYAYYIIGIGGTLLIIVLILVICCCTYTCYVKWTNRIVLPPSIKDPWGPLYYVRR